MKNLQCNLGLIQANEKIFFESQQIEDNFKRYKVQNEIEIQELKDKLEAELVVEQEKLQLYKRKFTQLDNQHNDLTLKYNDLKDSHVNSIIKLKELSQILQEKEITMQIIKDINLVLEKKAAINFSDLTPRPNLTFLNNILNIENNTCSTQFSIEVINQKMKSFVDENQNQSQIRNSERKIISQKTTTILLPPQQKNEIYKENDELSLSDSPSQQMKQIKKNKQSIADINKDSKKFKQKSIFQKIVQK